MEIVVGIGEYAVSNHEADQIKTFALASCVAVTAYCPSKKIGGMVHVVLPAPTREDQMQRSAYYATTGVPLLMDQLFRKFGCLKEELEVQIYGGADSMNGNDIFNIGRKNIEAVTKTLFQLHLKIHKAEVGGNQSRTIKLDIGTGLIEIHRQPIRI